MNTHPVQALDPVFDYLDNLIREQGDILFLGFAHVAIAVVVWVLCGGLRRRAKAQPELNAPPAVFICLSGRPPPPAPPFDPFPPGHEPSRFDDDDPHRN